LEVGFDSGRPNQVYLEVPGDYFVLEVDICLLVCHLAVKHEIAHVALLDEPFEELSEGSLEGHLLFVFGNKQHRKMPRPRDVLDLAEVVVSELFVAAVVLAAQVGDALAVGVGKTLPDGALGDVAADVLLVVRFFRGSFDLAGQVEHPDLLLLGLVEVENELLTGLIGSLLLLNEKVLLTRPIPICWRVEELLHRVGGAQLQLG